MNIYYVYENTVCPALKIRDNPDGSIELRFFPPLSFGVGEMVSVEAAYYDSDKTNETWHNIGD